MLRQLAAVQLDTISVLARSHELVAYARLGPVGRERVERAYWGSGSSTFEYWSHAACVLPLEEWPAFAIKRRIRLAKGKRWHVLQEQDKTCAEVFARLRVEGPLTANELGGAKKGGTWWDWSETKIAAEWLLDVGTLVCRHRRGFQRVYDLAERAIPEELLVQNWSDEECAARLVASAAAALGVATVADLAAYHGLPQRIVPRCFDRCGIACRKNRRLAISCVPCSECRRLGWKEISRPEHPPLAVRFADLVPGSPRKAVRSTPSTGGVHPVCEAPVRLLRHAGARRDPDRRSRRPGPPRRFPGGQASDRPCTRRHRAHRSRPSGSGNLGRSNRCHGRTSCSRLRTGGARKRPVANVRPQARG